MTITINLSENDLKKIVVKYFRDQGYDCDKASVFFRSDRDDRSGITCTTGSITMKGEEA